MMACQALQSRRQQSEVDTSCCTLLYMGHAVRDQQGNHCTEAAPCASAQLSLTKACMSIAGAAETTGSPSVVVRIFTILLAMQGWGTRHAPVYLIKGLAHDATVGIPDASGADPGARGAQL